MRAAGPDAASGAPSRSVAAPAGYTFWDHSNIDRTSNDFPNGKLDHPESVQDCAALCDQTAGCIGFVATPDGGLSLAVSCCLSPCPALPHSSVLVGGTPATCYLRKLLAGHSCATSVNSTSRPYSVYTRNSACKLPHGWKPAGPAVPPSAPPAPDSPATPYLLPNVTIGDERPVRRRRIHSLSSRSTVQHRHTDGGLLADTPQVFVRVDLRPASLSAPISLSLNWTVDPASEAPTTPIPLSALSPNVSAAQRQRRVLQEAASTGWNHWARRSQLAQIALPQHVGVELT